jgi:hypothetical protein
MEHDEHCILHRTVLVIGYQMWHVLNPGMCQVCHGSGLVGSGQVEWDTGFVDLEPCPVCVKEEEACPVCGGAMTYRFFAHSTYPARACIVCGWNEYDAPEYHPLPEYNCFCKEPWW